VIRGYKARLEAAPEDTETRLSLARAYARQGTLDASLQEYERLAKVPALAETLIQDLVAVIETHPDRSAPRRVLGDAYMRAGRLQKALDAYKEALAKL
jgi:cytochrome c-type biogenesis protein CcmH/NrfG